ncbi:MAG TPA: VOC family protein [Anaeromyxobacteraceae bacterium]|nr:VOC family protein [Anaeromyxobacteraceae bacterium]
MPQVESHLGTFVWRDLVTPDDDGARSFYAGMFGWTFEAMPIPHGGSYWIASAGGREIGGIMRTPPGSPAPPSWTSYASVADVDATCRTAADGGGRVLVPPTDIPRGGRFAVVQDPEGAVLGVLRAGSGRAPPPGRPQAGMFCWETLSARDPAKAKAFYPALLGWSETRPPGGDVTVFAARGGAQVADLQVARAGPPSWLTYVDVSSVVASRSRAAALGGKVVVPLVEVPKVGSIALVADPKGALLGLFQPDLEHRRD